MKNIIAAAAAAAMLGCAGCAVSTYEPAAYQSYSELSSEAVNWGFVRRKNAEPEVLRRDVDMLEAYGGYYIDETRPKALYLTFDEGYENGYTAKILDILQAAKVPAAFFVTGPYLENQPELIERMIREGHIVGNHTINHINMPSASAEDIKSELDGLNKMCMEKYGCEMKYVRPPEGSFSEKSLAVSRDMGYKTILWSFAYKDWDVNTQQGAQYAFDNVVPYLHDGAILLLHAVSSDNAAALEDIINYAKEQGYEFRSLNELGETGASAAPENGLMTAYSRRTQYFCKKSS